MADIIVAKNQTYRVIYRNGCAFRNSPQWADRWAVHAPNVPSDCGCRNTRDTPAECGAIVSGNVIRGTDSVSYLNVAPGTCVCLHLAFLSVVAPVAGFFLPIATADGKILIMEVVGSGQSAPALPVAPPRSTNCWALSHCLYGVPHDAACR